MPIGPSITPYPKQVNGKWGYVVTEDFWFWNCGVQDIVPAGFFTDGCSIPRLAWRVMGNPWHPPYCAAAVIHDFLYSSFDGQDPGIDRAVCDKVFSEVLKEWEVSAVTRQIMYRAVQVGGWVGYGGDAVIIPEYANNA